MGAYTIVLSKPICVVCKGAASHEVKNRYNASCGHYCAKHAAQKVRELDKDG